MGSTEDVVQPALSPQAARVAHFTVDERVARGKAVRAEVPRSSHAAWEPSPHRPDPIDLLEEQARVRVPELVPIRYGRMLLSPFAFYRGGAYLMASDLAGGPRTGLHTQLCGDAHLSNFGGFAAPDRRMVFSVNDFDETLPGPFEWDVKRLAASFAVAGRDRGLDDRQRDRVTLAGVRAYRTSLARFAAMRNLDLWYARIDVEAILGRFGKQATAKQRKQFQANVAKARAKDSLRAFAKLTHLTDGEPRIVSDPPLLVPIEDLVPAADHALVVEFARGALRAYRRSLSGDRRRLLERFRYAHIARKVVGVGSVGTRAWVVLMLGRDGGDPLFLQVKEAQASVLEPFLGKSAFSNHGQRVVEGQRLMQAASDILLGWSRIDGMEVDGFAIGGGAGAGRDFYVRQLWDAKGSADLEVMPPATLILYAELCGWTLARAHARSGDALAIASYLGTSDTFDRALATFAESYADQNERDYEALRLAVATGRVDAIKGV